jgi:undecaprenyl diphosphate synthase
MDGNGRWATQQGWSRLIGHRAGTERVRDVIQACLDWEIPVLSLYAFSTENWLRPHEEVQGLFEIMANFIDREIAELKQNGVRIRHLGSLEDVPGWLADRLRSAVCTTQDNSRLVLNVAFNYGSRAELVRAVRAIVEAGTPVDQIDEALIARHLDTAGIPDPDLIIRTAGEMRLSNFLLWQAAYAEYWSTDVFWPDLNRDLFQQALRDFGRRQRRFGALSGAERSRNPASVIGPENRPSIVGRTNGS